MVFTKRVSIHDTQYTCMQIHVGYATKCHRFIYCSSLLYVSLCRDYPVCSATQSNHSSSIHRARDGGWVKWNVLLRATVCLCVYAFLVQCAFGQQFRWLSILLKNSFSKVPNTMWSVCRIWICQTDQSHGKVGCAVNKFQKRNEKKKNKPLNSLDTQSVGVVCLVNFHCMQFHVHNCAYSTIGQHISYYCFDANRWKSESLNAFFGRLSCGCRYGRCGAIQCVFTCGINRYRMRFGCIHFFCKIVQCILNFDLPLTSVAYEPRHTHTRTHIR